MSGHLKGQCLQDGRRLRYPKSAAKCLTERAVERIDAASATQRKARESWEQLVKRLDIGAPSSLRPKDLKRVIEEIWDVAPTMQPALANLEDASNRGRKSIDRTIITTYLRAFPREHPGFGNLASASRKAADRHEWPWRERGDTWRLWRPQEAPRALAEALLATDEPASILGEAGLMGDLADGRLVGEAIARACETVSEARGEKAETAGGRLISLFRRLNRGAEHNGLLAYALLKPWLHGACGADHQKAIISLLVSRNGDPRSKKEIWKALEIAAQKLLNGAEDVPAVFSVIRRWLVQKTVREFFKIVAATTDRQDQWKQRTDFWLSYLDAGYISDAWFAFGSMAERQAQRFIDQEDGLSFGRISGQGADASSSALLLELGDLTIAEWSHNGMSRFWKAGSQKAPRLYQEVYFSAVLRSMDAATGYDPLSHQGTWQYKFARRIYERTGIKHPKFGAGY